jgi:hypothetical protein
MNKIATLAVIGWSAMMTSQANAKITCAGEYENDPKIVIYNLVNSAKLATQMQAPTANKKAAGLMVLGKGEPIDLYTGYLKKNIDRGGGVHSLYKLQSSDKLIYLSWKTFPWSNLPSNCEITRQGCFDIQLKKPKSFKAKLVIKNSSDSSSHPIEVKCQYGDF